MADNQETQDSAANGEDSSPQVGVISQYVKDLSFENPNAPHVYQWQDVPELEVQFNIGSNAVADDVHEVMLRVEVRAVHGDRVYYQIDLAYGGLFGLRNIPAEHLQPVLLAEAPRILFPFARRVLADAVRDGGFPPLLLEPIDFASVYLAQAQQGQIPDGEPVGTA